MILNHIDKIQSLSSAILDKDANFNVLLKYAQTCESDNIFIAGGALRDALLNRLDFKDIDIFISSQAFEKLYELISEKGKLIKNPFGSFRWYPDIKDNFYYDIIIIEKFYNGLWGCENITDVLNQFDITANAVAFDIKTNDFFNPQNGLLHIEKKLLRAIRFDYPEIPLSNKIPLSRNSILWFRYKYYEKKLGFRVDKITQNWIDSNSYRYKDIEDFKRYFFDPLF